MKLLDIVIDCSLTAVGAFILFPTLVQVAAASPAVLLALLGAGVMLAIYGDSVMKE